MRLLTGIVALIALISAVPTFASDVTTDRYFAPNAGHPIAATAQAEPRRAAEPKPCSCDCLAKSDHAARRAETSPR
jgi:hypothetical protein